MTDTSRTELKHTNLTGKLLALGVLAGITWIATMFVWGVIQDRESRQTEAADEISAQWSRPQTIAGPVLTVPVEQTSVTTEGKAVISTHTLTLLPKELAYTSTVEGKLLARGAYETPVYTTTVQGAGSFDLTSSAVTETATTHILWNKAVVSINITDTRGITSNFDITLGDKQYPLLPSSEFTTLDTSGVHAAVPLDGTQPHYTFSFELHLKGSRDLAFLPLGEHTQVTVKSDWQAPSFTGEFLPESRTITDSGFEATWNITSYGKNLPQSWVGSATGIDATALLSKAFGVGLYQAVDFYTMVDRSVKYSILFISLTFLTFFLYEVLSGLRIHPMQYLLVGLAIALFYLLLLSFAEIIGFLPAYLVSTTSITLLITGYCFSVLKAKRRALSITILLGMLYIYLYILLQLDQYSLLFGSLLLFGVLSTVMFITRKLDWYALGSKE